jgi:hypothetical protein
VLPTIDDEPLAAPEPAHAAGTPRRRLAAVGIVIALVLGVLVLTEVLDDGRPSAPAGGWTLLPHTGLGAWVDVYDWTTELGGASPSVGLEDIDAMAEAGVQTLYLQTSRSGSAEDVVEPELLDSLIDRAHEHDLFVVAWYLPTFVDVDEDLRRLTAAAELRVDGLGVDIEATDLDDPVERNRRLIDLSNRLREAVGADKAIAAITLSSVHLQVVNPEFWPRYPWAEIGATYDAILPMAYWSIRVGELAEGGRYVGENIDRIRASVGRDDVPIHPVGGIADGASLDDLTAMVAAIEDRGAIGGSLYDWSTSTPEQWAALAPLRRLRP